MSFKYHFLLMADYNRRVNDQIYKVTSNLTKEELTKDAGAFFGSIMGTLNHILVADLLWLARFALHTEKYVSLKKVDEFPKPKALKEVIYRRFIELYGARTKVDAIIQKWVKDETKEKDFKLNLGYQSMNGRVCRRNFGELVSHFFNHQTHHRGQVSTLLKQLGHDIGVTDFVIDIPVHQTYVQSSKRDGIQLEEPEKK